MEAALSPVETPEAFAALALCNSHLLGVEWIAAGRDLQVCLRHTSGSGVTLVCTGAHSVKLHLESDLGQRGSPLVWQADMGAALGYCQLTLHFGITGGIQLMCNQILSGPLA